MPYFADGSDAYANNKQFFVSIQHVPSQKYVMFKAFITAFNETYKCNWGSESVFGRQDPIYSFKSTDRQVTLNLNIPASSESEAFENLAKIGLLSDMLYPNYTNLGQANTISQSPLVRMKVMNLLASQKEMYSISRQNVNGGMTYNNLQFGHNSAASRGQLGVITSLSINHNIDKPDAGVFEMGINTVLPKFIDISISFDVIHEVPRGWNTSGRAYNGGPYGLDLQNNTTNAYIAASQIDSENRNAFNRAELERQVADELGDIDRPVAQQSEENARARNANLMSQLGTSVRIRTDTSLSRERRRAEAYYASGRSDRNMTAEEERFTEEFSFASTPGVDD